MQLYNTPTKLTETITAQSTDFMSVYTCGPTVYDYPHVGNWFTFVRYDLLVRTLQLSEYNTKWVLNITDVGHLVSDADEGEDKLEKGAKREGKTACDIATFYTDYFVAGLARLNIQTPDVMPKATDHIPEQIALIQRLETNGYTYAIDDGVYYDTSRFPTYAAFASLDLEDQQAGARVTFNAQKRNASDFALWKFSPANETRDMEWDSPWGKGFPGWHLECSAMAMKYLGETMDIHAGGIDHIPVHHTNEIAQSEGATGKPYAHYWMHANHITVDGEKISKSLGNSITLEDIEAKGISLEAFRLHVLESHYRTQSKFSWDSLISAQNRLTSIQEFADLRFQAQPDAKEIGDDYFEVKQKAMRSALVTDLNTPVALRVLSEVLNTVAQNGLHAKYTDGPAFTNFLKFIDSSLGLTLMQSQDITSEQKALIQARTEARHSGDWATSDTVRDQLQAQGIGLRDFAGQVIWLRLR